MLSFIDWLRSRVFLSNIEKENKCMDKIASDKNFPQSVCLWIMVDYMESKHYGKREIDTFETIYLQEYIKYISSASDPDLL